MAEYKCKKSTYNISGPSTFVEKIVCSNLGCDDSIGSLLRGFLRSNLKFLDRELRVFKSWIQNASRLMILILVHSLLK